MNDARHNACTVEHEIEPAAQALADFIRTHPRLLVITGAGVSTDSGIPDYRDHTGAWKRRAPVQHHDFMTHLSVRQRYWARALVGFSVMQQACSSPVHHALARLEQAGYIHQLITQNVDQLHQRAGSRRVIDLHGRADVVCCMNCGHRMMRYALHEQMAACNPDFAAMTATVAPDGDADLEDVDFSSFQVVNCARCGGLFKPDVVFYGDVVPVARARQAREALDNAEALLTLGTSLMVYSGYRFCRLAHERGLPIASLNLGVTRADALLSLKLNAPLAPVLDAALTQLGL
ncbi:NAD-dependent deacetylase [Terasakiispira papahanaumokuakeensis]|uniref:protein acetyllysine N-acetyltransferase n=1 Tax=Terasakiispira papahanaumokuakeensis TaxID=197479 RepID=A0A1E2VE73_9GAMM|nr:NAD-dependent protein deacetylase [Terasakiispira papahanaumokuakeensis]ODC04965.1 NAD-dependent deacetylase [Terasakiispira papahanaumokuakeensis]